MLMFERMGRMSFKEIKPEEIVGNPFTMIGKQWMLITAGDEKKFNTMTASWGSMGIMWGKKAVTTYIRPQRYTKEFVDTNDTFTITLFDEAYRSALNLCGSVSGRDRDKVKEAGLTPYYVDGTTAFEEASIILVCKKMYHVSMPPENFDDQTQDAKWYPDKDYHTMYISEILKVLIKE